MTRNLARILYALLLLAMLAALPLSATHARDAALDIWLAPTLPADLRAAVLRLAHSDRYAIVSDAGNADLRLDITADAGAEGMQWVYAVVAPFPTITDAVTWEEVRGFWAGASNTLEDTPRTLVLGISVADTLGALWGAPDDAAPIEVVPDGGAAEAAWEAQRASWSIVPFHRLDPRWKVLIVDGVDLRTPTADLSAYPLAFTIVAEGAQSAQLMADIALVGGWTHDTNRDPARMTVLTMTGVTALTRGTAQMMEQEGVLYPAQDVAPLLQRADLLHINNEIAFAEDCPDPGLLVGGIRLCARPTYFELLTYVGADIIELTGNHPNDWGTEAFEQTLQMYADAGMVTFGGGRTPTEAAEPLIVTHNGNTLGFVGCNPVGTEKAWADDRHGGALRCDYDRLTATITQLSREVDVVVATQQYWEYDSVYPGAQQRIDFGRLARAGADIVSGSQAHVTQGFAFAHGAFIHYGLGNMFFDQRQNLDVRRSLIDQHLIYDGRHISTTLLTVVRDDAARVRVMSPQERTNFLWYLFNASTWQ